MTHTCTPYTHVPEKLDRLPELAANLWFSWNSDALKLFADLDSRLWEVVLHNPVKLLNELDPARLAEAAEDKRFIQEYLNVMQQFDAEITGDKTWFDQTSPQLSGHLIAYFSMEFGLHESLPVYSGGLGILAGDHLKAASNLGIPLVGVGLLYRVSYFKQFVTGSGHQQAVYEGAEFSGLPVRLMLDHEEMPVTVTVPAAGRDIHVRIWKVDVGRIPLLLLDTDFPKNSPEDRLITERLYDSDRDYRLLQELVLGIGGVRAFKTLGLPVTLFHLNEGHSAFLNLERLRVLLKQGLNKEEALRDVKEFTVFTTHTPVPAGNEVFEMERINRIMGPHKEILEFEDNWGRALGQSDEEKQKDTFNLTIFALRTSTRANGVSQLHGNVSRDMWQRVWPGLEADQVPIQAITNGVHGRTWIHGSMQELFSEYLGEEWYRHLDEADFWEKTADIPDEALWQVHQEIKQTLIHVIRGRIVKQRDRNGESRQVIDSARNLLNPDALTIGFARRFAPYKRATLLLRDLERLKKLAASADRPVQFIFAGKAHPADTDGRALIREVIEASRSEGLENNLVFVENYDMALSRFMVAGCDCWLNTPRRPHEASGTSGMKAAMNGCLNISVLDGWWAEADDDSYGWTIGDAQTYSSLQEQDEADSLALYDILENRVVPVYYQREGSGASAAWIKLMKNSISGLIPRFNTVRMLKEYFNLIYFKTE